jgi:putative aldouronate transport system permease protein
MLPPCAYFVFSYMAMLGLVVAFQGYRPAAGFFGANVKWVGLKHSYRFINSMYFSRLMINTLRFTCRTVPTSLCSYIKRGAG